MKLFLLIWLVIFFLLVYWNPDQFFVARSNCTDCDVISSENQMCTFFLKNGVKWKWKKKVAKDYQHVLFSVLKFSLMWKMAKALRNDLIKWQEKHMWKCCLRKNHSNYHIKHRIFVRKFIEMCPERNNLTKKKRATCSFFCFIHFHGSNVKFFIFFF